MTDQIRFAALAVDAVKLGSAAVDKIYHGANQIFGGASLPPFDLTNFSYTLENYDGSALSTVAMGVHFSPDGLNMYISDIGSSSIYQYSLSTAWDLATVSYTGKSKNVAAQDTSISDLVFKPDGTKLFISGGQTDDCYQYSLSTAWDISTAVYDTKFIDTSVQDSSLQALFISSDGTKLFTAGAANDRVYRYNLTTPWDFGAYTYIGFKSISAQDTTPTAISFNPDGTKMFLGGVSTNKVYQYSLSTAWDISTAVYDNISLDVSPEDGAYGMFMRTDGNRLYCVGANENTVFEYSNGV